jgi:ATPase subunit of ABC transporter with duplicated ATPase domains
LLIAFRTATGLAEVDARTLLAKFDLYESHVLRSTGSLSPGERTRAELAVQAARAANCLVLDEPTNHLDLPAVEELERALDAYGGTLLLVSHDRRFLERVGVTRVVELSRPARGRDRARARRRPRGRH